jgi:hypothetical protein
MKRSDKTTITLFMANNAVLLQNLSIAELADKISEGTNIVPAKTTIAGLRQDLKWPALRKKSVRLENRVHRLEQTLDYIIFQLNIELPNRLK